MTDSKPQLTHREVKKPRISLRYLADYMAAGDRHRAKNSILQMCRYQKLAKMYNHTEAKAAIRDHFNGGGGSDVSKLCEKAQALRERIDDSAFDRNLYDYNADYLDAFCEHYSKENMPSQDLLAATPVEPTIIGGVEVRFDTFARFRRFMKNSNRERTGRLTLRYEKGKNLPSETGVWQSAIMHAHLTKSLDGVEIAPEEKLTVTYCVVSGKLHTAPTDSISRFNEVKAACATIAAAWENISAPKGAIF